jgi:TPR repeat protein
MWRMELRRPSIGACVSLGGALLLAACSQPSRLNLQCITGDLQRCRQLGDMYVAGNGVPQDFARAASLYERVCDAGVAEVCNSLAEIYARVPGFESESTRVPGLYERACTAGSAAGCLNWGLLAHESEDDQKAASLFERACVGGNAAGCHHLALAFENGEGVDKDLAKAVTLFEQACDAQHADSCLTLVRVFSDGAETTADPARVGRYNAQLLQLYSDGCESGIARDCRERDALKTRMALGR